MIFSKAEEEPFEEPMEETEHAETSYMGEGPGESREDKTEASETAYMGEPAEESEPKHETEYKRGGPHRGKATLQSHKGGKKEEHEHDGGEDESPEPGIPDFWPSTELGADENWEPPTRNKPDSAPWEEE